MELKVESVERNPSAEQILAYAKHLRNVVGTQAFLPFLRGEKVEYVDIQRGITVTYQLSEPAKEVLREEEKSTQKKTRQTEQT